VTSVKPRDKACVNARIRSLQLHQCERRSD
jgi:hypothetical protein